MCFAFEAVLIFFTWPQWHFFERLNAYMHMVSHLLAPYSKKGSCLFPAVVLVDRLAEGLKKDCALN